MEEGKKIAKENFDIELGAANKESERKLDEAKRNVKIVHGPSIQIDRWGW